MKKLLAFFLSMMLLSSAALADTTLSGTVVAAEEQTILAPADGILAQVYVQAGQRVAAGETVAALLDTTVYADQAGTVSVFGQPGASLEVIADTYGGVVFLQPDVKFTLTASTKYAYDAEENTRIIPGETVYLASVSDGNVQGQGRVTGVSGENFMVSVESGEFTDGEKVYVYRAEERNAKSRIGRGSMAYQGPVGYTGNGQEVSISSGTTSGRGMPTATTTEATTDEATAKSLMKVLVADGQHVEAGDALFTVTMAEAYHQAMTAEESGVVTSVAVTPGASVTAGTAIATLNPDSGMRLALHVEESDLSKVQLGTQVNISFLNGETAVGTVEGILGLAEDATEEDEEAVFTVYVAFPAAETIAYGMTGKVTIAD